MAAKHARARCTVMSIDVVGKLEGTAPHLTLCTLTVDGRRLLDRHTERRRHQSAPPLLAPKAPVVKEVRVHADHTYPLQWT